MPPQDSPTDMLRRGPLIDTGSQQEVAKVVLERRQVLERHVRDRPADVESYLELAAIYRDSERPTEATRTLKAALEIEPDHAVVLWELEEAELARALRQLRDVREVAERLNNREADHELERAKVDWANRRASVCRARLARDPENHHLRVVLAEALRELEEFDEAIAALQPALACASEAPLAFLLLGHCRHAQGEVLPALSAWRHAAMRRAVPAPAKVRIAALSAAVTAAEALGLNGSLKIYRQALQQAQAESDLSEQTESNNR